MQDNYLLNDAIKCPGLTNGTNEIHALARELPKRISIFFYKKTMPFASVVFIGGTGTGKSTLFNTFLGENLSETGVERPKTCGPIVYIHKDCRFDNNFPFPAIKIERHFPEYFRKSPASGAPGRMIVIEHDRKDLSHLILADTPDLDSVDGENRQTAENLYLLSDVIIFVTSQEKYADEVPYQFLRNIIQEKKPYFFLINKVRENFNKEEVLNVMKGRGVSPLRERTWLIPFEPSASLKMLSEYPGFNDFLDHFSEELSKKKIKGIKKRQFLRDSEDLKTGIGRLLNLLEMEKRAADKWHLRLNSIIEETSSVLIEEEQKRFSAKSREYLSMEIKRLFTKYDLLARPRRCIKEIFISPLRVFGLIKKSKVKRGKEALLDLQQKIDLTPVRTSIERLNRLVLEKLSPQDEYSPLFMELRKPGLVLTNEEIMVCVKEEQERLAAWLEKRFEELSERLPKGKKWGIYSTSILWGMLILSVEAVAGGGFSVLDAVLDSAIAPFITKGAVELFAYHEIQKIARELAKRYQDGLLSVVYHQSKRYEKCLESLMTKEEDVAALKKLVSTL
ncbi:MAG: GTPase domain-containing protein [Deltaproteobacteria bacterium]|nr:GTPase domain-containing protein [Deltaproteobacteria bacterium]